jgi:hypothetical protein
MFNKSQLLLGLGLFGALFDFALEREKEQYRYADNTHRMNEGG